jgi:hypothetical protein
LLEPVDAPYGTVSTSVETLLACPTWNNEPNPAGQPGCSPTPPRPLRRTRRGGKAAGLTRGPLAPERRPLRRWKDRGWRRLGKPATRGKQNNPLRRCVKRASTGGPSLRRRGRSSALTHWPLRQPGPSAWSSLSVAKSSVRFGARERRDWHALHGCSKEACSFRGAGRLRSPSWGKAKAPPASVACRFPRSCSLDGTCGPTPFGVEDWRAPATLRGCHRRLPDAALRGGRWRTDRNELCTASRSDTALHQAYWAWRYERRTPRLVRAGPARCG